MISPYVVRYPDIRTNREYDIFTPYGYLPIWRKDTRSDTHLVTKRFFLHSLLALRPFTYC